MARVNSKERFSDFGARGKFGLAWEYGQKIYGQGHYGMEEIEWDYNEFGFATFGITLFGSDDKRWGIYQKRIENGDVFFIRQDFYIPSDPKSVDQMTMRNKFSAGMIAWGNLTTEQKEVYNKKGSKLGLPGQNVFMKEYLNSH